MDTAESKKSDRQRVKLILAYDGTRFKGFQRQSSSGSSPSATANPRHYKRRRLDGEGNTEKVPLTIQECVEDALEQFSGLSRTDMVPRFAGRTDAGVHARGQVLVVWLPKHLSDATWKVRKSVNSRLPTDISVEKVEFCGDDFDPREHAISKEYSYLLKYRRQAWDSNGELLPICGSGPDSFRSGLDSGRFWCCPWSFDDRKLNEYVEKLCGEHDFSVFVHKEAREEGKPNFRTIDTIDTIWKYKTEEEAPVVTLKLVFRAKGFARSMVRNLVGFLIDVCRGQVDDSIFEELWTGSSEVAKQIHSAPACGLCLERVQY